MTKRVATASSFVDNLFVSGVMGGTHALCSGDIKRLIAHLSLNQGDIFWEIGCGVPNLAFSLSAASFGGMVICTDIRKYCYNCINIDNHKAYCYIQHQFMTN
jgi:precorrin-6B methylase 2